MGDHPQQGIDRRRGRRLRGEPADLGEQAGMGSAAPTRPASRARPVRASACPAATRPRCPASGRPPGRSTPRRRRRALRRAGAGGARPAPIARSASIRRPRPAAGHRDTRRSATRPSRTVAARRLGSERSRPARHAGDRPEADRRSGLAAWLRSGCRAAVAQLLDHLTVLSEWGSRPASPRSCAAPPPAGPAPRRSGQGRTTPRNGVAPAPKSAGSRTDALQLPIR